MEKLVRVKKQWPLSQRSYTDRKDGQQKTFNSVKLLLTDGNDTFVAEIVGEAAVNSASVTYDQNAIYAMRAKLTVREWTSQQGEQLTSNEITILNLNLV